MLAAGDGFNKVSAAAPMALEQALDPWSVDYLEPPSALQEIVREYVRKTGYSHVGKAIARLELPEQA